MTSTAAWPQLLRDAGLRVTQPRVAVLAAIQEHPHADTDTVIQAVRDQLPASHQAVYDVLRALTGAGLLRKIQPIGSLARYEGRVGDNHHHVVCRGCGAIADVDCAVGSTPCLTGSVDNGFVIDEAEVTYWGWCPDCAAARQDPMTPSTPATDGPTDVIDPAATGNPADTHPSDPSSTIVTVGPH